VSARLEHSDPLVRASAVVALSVITKKRDPFAIATVKEKSLDLITKAAAWQALEKDEDFGEERH